MHAAGRPRLLTLNPRKVQIPLDRQGCLKAGCPLGQQLAGHADPRTTRLYDRRQRRVTRNIVERISI